MYHKYIYILLKSCSVLLYAVRYTCICMLVMLYLQKIVKRIGLMDSICLRRIITCRYMTMYNPAELSFIRLFMQISAYIPPLPESQPAVRFPHKESLPLSEVLPRQRML